MKKITESALYLSRVRTARVLRKRQRIRHHKDNGSTASSLPINLLKRCSNGRDKRTGTSELIKLPSTFSLIDDPKGFLEVVNGINVSDMEKLRDVYVDHSKVTKIDLAAESILDFIVMEMRNARHKRRRLRVGGVLPDNDKTNRYVRAIGIVKNLDIRDKLIGRDQDNRLRIFSMRHKSNFEGNDSCNDWKSMATAEFVKHINDCLHDHNKKLNRRTEGRLASYIGEILNNAEDHSGHDKSVIVGYLDNASDNHLCEIAIFNFGKTIAESFRDMPDNSYTRVEISEYIEKHTKSSFFSSDWSKDDLLTLVALQGHISSKNLTKSQDRGQGTVDLIEFFQKMHKSCVGDIASHAEMAILSGSTFIHFDGTYKMAPDYSGRKVIAFNEDNDLGKRPSHRHVKRMSGLRFPGTVISIRFPMKDDSIESLGDA